MPARPFSAPRSPSLLLALVVAAAACGPDDLADGGISDGATTAASSGTAEASGGATGASASDGSSDGGEGSGEAREKGLSGGTALSADALTGMSGSAMAVMASRCSLAMARSVAARPPRTTTSARRPGPRPRPDSSASLSAGS